MYWSTLYMIANVIILLLTVPHLLKKANIKLNILLLMVYKIVFLIIQGGVIANMQALLLLLPFLLIYSILLLNITKKFLLNTFQVGLVVGFTILEMLSFYLILFLYSALSVIIFA